MTLDNSKESNGWTEYRRLVLQEIERLDTSIKEVQSGHKGEILAIQAAINDLRVTTIEQLNELRHIIDVSHEKQYHILEQRVRHNENSLIGIYGKAAGISFIVGLLVSIVGVVAMILAI